MKGGEDNIIVVKKSISISGHHGGAWKVAYADFVTAMMALFIVLWILGQEEEIKKMLPVTLKILLDFLKNESDICIRWYDAITN